MITTIRKKVAYFKWAIPEAMRHHRELQHQRRQRLEASAMSPSEYELYWLAFEKLAKNHATSKTKVPLGE